MKKLLLIILFIATLQGLKAQQYALFGTKTLFDAFENPSQKSFTLDSSRRFSSNFFMPYFGANAANKGPASLAIRTLTQSGEFDASSVSIGSGKINRFYQNSNVYVAAFRIFKSYKYQKEMGFAWQVRSDAHINYTNESIAIFDTYKRFNAGQLYNDIFDTKGYQQTYHQFSFTYRENWDKRLAFGFKASILSGILYNKLDVTNSSLYIDPATNAILIGFNGSYYSNFKDFRDINRNQLLPNFKNPGLALSFGTNYTTKKGLFLMANLKDLGFIWWRSGTNQTIVDQNKLINGLSGSNNVNEKITDIFLDARQNAKFTAATNAKLDAFATQRFGEYYQGGVAVSKNLFYQGGDIAFINTFYTQNFSGSITPLYNFNKVFMIGIQAKYQTPNFEVFLGSDNIVGTGDQTFGLINKNAMTGSGPNGASVYFGLGIKFGDIVNHPQFSDVMPGINDKEEGSFFKSLFGIFRKKKG